MHMCLRFREPKQTLEGLDGSSHNLPFVSCQILNCFMFFSSNLKQKNMVEIHKKHRYIENKKLATKSKI